MPLKSENPIEYQNGQLYALYNEVGRYLFANGQEPARREYTIKDHLGNTRVVISDVDNDGEINLDPSHNEPDEVLQTNNYYPFGMEIEGLQPNENVLNYRYQYNGKEFFDLDLNWLDYGARWYDPSIGRWTSVDPMADLAPDWTPYRYGFNNPLSFIDPDGMFETEAAAKQYAKENGIKTGLFRRNKIHKNKSADGTVSYSIDNNKEGTSIQDHGGDIGVLKSEVTVKADDVMSVVYDKPNQSKLDMFISGRNINRTETLRDGSERRWEVTEFEVPPLPVGPGGASRLTQLGRYFASLSQMSSKGKVIAISVRDAPRLVAMYGGKAKDWVKMSSTTYTDPRGFKFATHWYKNIKTGQVVEYKTKLGG